jgi:hypothetical protein
MDDPNDPPKSLGDIIDQIDLMREQLGAIQHRLEQIEGARGDNENNGHRKWPSDFL